jgi:hypothetical protein
MRNCDIYGPWVYWDFGEMRVHPTHYAIDAFRIKSWVLEGSVDGDSWTEIARKTGRQDQFATFSFHAISTLWEGGFIRLTQTDKNYYGFDYLLLSAVEFFGTLFEYKCKSIRTQPVFAHRFGLDS